MSRKEQVLASVALAACVLAQPAQGADLDKLKGELAKEKPGSQSERVLLNALGHESFKAGKKEDGRKYFKKIKKCEKCVVYESVVKELFLKENILEK